MVDSDRAHDTERWDTMPEEVSIEVSITTEPLPPDVAACLASSLRWMDMGRYSHVIVANEDDAKEAVLYLNNALQVGGSYYRDNDGIWFVYAI